MEAAKLALSYGLLKNHTVQTADAKQAYTQALMDNSVIENWIELPESQWPARWFDPNTGAKLYYRPVVPLRLALYGHQNSGGYWEMHCEKHLKDNGFVDVPDWRSCFWHAELKVLLVFYVDDFMLTGPDGSMAEAWRRIRGDFDESCVPETAALPRTQRKGLELDPVETGSKQRFLGCTHHFANKETPIMCNTMRTVTFDMDDFLKQCVKR